VFLTALVANKRLVLFFSGEQRIDAFVLLYFAEKNRDATYTRDKRLWIWIYPWISTENLWIWIRIWTGNFVSTASLGGNLKFESGEGGVG